MTNDEILRKFASRYVWWKTPDEALQMPERVIAQVMNVGDYDDVQTLVNAVGESVLQNILNNAEAGVSLASGLAAAREIFGPNFQPSESLKALVYFEDGDLAGLTKSENDTLIAAIKKIRDLPAAKIMSLQLTSS
jgi:hypothetical protein